MQAFGRAMSYSTQSHFMLSIPLFQPTVHERWFLTFKFIQNFFLGTLFITIFSMQMIAPEVKLATDDEIKSIRGYSPEPISDFGIGEPCLYELKRGKNRVLAISNELIITSQIRRFIHTKGMLLELRYCQ